MITEEFNDWLREQTGLSVIEWWAVYHKQKATQPLTHSDGSIHEFVIKGFRCHCGCNVFHKPDKTKLNIYACNACDNTFEVEVQ